MNLLIRAAQIVDATSAYDGQRCDLLIENGLIRQIGTDIPAPDGIRVIAADNLHVSPGWIDMRVLAQDPGFEHKEDLTSVCRTATAGGFTDIVLLPNTQPVVDAKGPLATYNG